MSWLKKIYIFILALLYLTSIAVWVIIPQMVTLNICTVVFTLCCSFFYLARHAKSYGHFLKSRQFKGIANATISSFLLFGILALLNYLVFKHPAYMDFSSSKQNTLGEKSRAVLGQLDGPLYFKAFVGKTQRNRAHYFLDYFRPAKKDLFVEFYDPDLHPQLSQKYGINRPDILVIEYKGRFVSTDKWDESSITSKLLSLSRSHSKTIYYIVGHGEYSLDLKHNFGLSILAKKIKEQYFNIQTINLLQTQKIPSDALAIILWGPKKALLKEEINAIENYVANGGHLLAAFEPHLNGYPHRDMAKVLKKWGIVTKNALVVDQIKNINGSKGWIPLVQRYNNHHVITKDFKVATFFPLATVVEADKDKMGKFILQELFHSSGFPASWADFTPEETLNERLQFHAKVDQKGPIPLAVSSVSKKTSARVLVFGNGSFVQNVYANKGGNHDLFLNSLSWLANEEFTISNEVNKKERALMLSSPALATVFYFSVLFCPLIMFASSFLLYRRKKRV